MVFALALAVWVHAAPAPGGNPDLERAKDFVLDLRFAEAVRALDAAAKRPWNSRPAVIAIAELQGVASGVLGKADKSRRAFQLLLELSPDYELAPSYAPSVKAPFAEAKQWVVEHGSLKVEAPPVDSQALSARVWVANDPMHLVEAVRFHVVRGDAREVRTQPLSGGAAETALPNASAKWWAEVLGARQAVLVELGTEFDPLGVAPPAEPVVAARQPEPPAVKPDAPLAVATEKPKPPVPVATPASPPREAVQIAERSEGTSLRPVAYACLGAGVIAAGVGGYFGWQSASERAQLDQKTSSTTGVVQGITQRDAYALDARARGDAVLANALLAGGAAALVAGGILWAVGGTSSVHATPAGVGGSF